MYEGPSLLTGDPIVAIATGLDGQSLNEKTGPMVQVWILRSDIDPMRAKRQNLDDAICGSCALRGHEGVDSACYVTVWHAPNNVFRSFSHGDYPRLSWSELQAVMEGRSARLGAYGDPAAVPFEVWQVVLASLRGWVAYTHAWRTCDPRLASVCMASVETARDFHDASRKGWRVFRVRGRGEPLIAGVEFVCPASDESGHRTTCHECQLCRGHASPARSVAIYVHGKASNVKAFRVSA